MSFGGHSTVSFTGNRAEISGRPGSSGGAIDLDASRIIFNGLSAVIFNRNYANSDGSAIYFMPFTISHHVLFTDHSIVTFSNNIGRYRGGAISISNDIKGLSTNVIMFTGNSKVIFSNNTAPKGGVLHFIDKTSKANVYPRQMIFQRNANVTFVNNSATQGGAIWALMTFPCHIYRKCCSELL